MSQKNLYGLLKEAVSLIVEGKFNQADQLLGDPFTKAFKAEADPALKQAAQTLHGELHNAKLPAAHNHIKPFAQEALQLLSHHEEIGNPKAASMGQVSAKFHDAMHKIDGIRADQAEALTRHEAALYKEKGALGYNWDLVKRRFGVEDARAGAEVDIGHAHKSPCSHGSSHSHAHGASSSKSVGLASTAEQSATPPRRMGMAAQMAAQAKGEPSAAAPAVSEALEAAIGRATSKQNVSLKGTSLEEFGRVKQVNTVGRKLAFGAGSAVGLGLFVHGGHNMFRAFMPSKDEQIEVEALGHGKDEGVNWVRLGVGVGEAAVGAVAMHRALTGRLGIGTVKGTATNIMGCTH